MSRPRPAKRSQLTNATYRNIVGCNMLCAFGHCTCVAMCCDMLGVVGSNLTIFTLEPTTPYVSQRIATRWPNARNMLHPTMLRYVALTCCDRLAGALGPASTLCYSSAAVIRVVTQRFSLTSGENRCVTTLITAAKETTTTATIYWYSHI